MKKVIVLGLGLFLLTGCGGSTTSSSSDTTTKSSAATESSQAAQKTYSLGETASVDDVDYTLTAVELTDERNQFEESEPANVVKVSYTVMNNSDEDLAVGMDASLYDSQGKKMESYANTNTMGSVAAGKSMDVVKHFALDSLGETEIQFAPVISIGKDAAIFKVDVQ